MQTSLTFKNLDSSDHLKAYVQDKLDRFDRFLDNPGDATVVLSVEKHRHTAEININAGRLKLNGKEETNDMYLAIDTVMDKLEKQIKRGKEKMRDRRAKGSARAGDAGMAFDAEGDDEAEIIVKTIEYKPMDAEEAVMQLDLADDSFLVFTNSRTNQINVVYRRNDGHYGLIQPTR